METTICLFTSSYSARVTADWCRSRPCMLLAREDGFQAQHPKNGHEPLRLARNIRPICPSHTL